MCTQSEGNTRTQASIRKHSAWVVHLYAGLGGGGVATVVLDILCLFTVLQEPANLRMTAPLCSPSCAWSTVVTFRDATSWLRAYAECCLLRIVTVVSVTANFLLIYCDVYVCLVLNCGSF